MGEPFLFGQFQKVGRDHGERHRERRELVDDFVLPLRDEDPVLLDEPELSNRAGFLAEATIQRQGDRALTGANLE